MPEELLRHAHELRAHLTRFFKTRVPELFRANRWSADVGNRLEEFILNGKHLRGSLFLATAKLYGARKREQAYQVAAALEFLHSGLVVHDDIMDRDMLRRGKPSMHAQYMQAAFGVHDAQSLAVCVGDIALFTGFALLAEVNVSPARRARMGAIAGRELIRTGLAQMEDVGLASSRRRASTRDIVEMYRLKTARYTFCLPFALAFAFAGTTSEKHRRLAATLDNIGETLGIVFQIKDEELGVFGSEKELGKPVGSDIRENKPTILARELFAAATTKEKKALARIFGNPKCSKKDIELVRAMVREKGIDAKVRWRLHALRRSCKRLIESLPLRQKEKEFFTALLHYSLTRTK